MQSPNSTPGDCEHQNHTCLVLLLEEACDKALAQPLKEGKTRVHEIGLLDYSGHVKIFSRTS